MISTATTRAYLIAWIVCCAATLFIIWHNEFLPMVDLPAYAGTIGMLAQLQSGWSPFEAHYIVDWWQPYILASLFSFFFSLFVGVPAAIKIVLSITAIGFPISLWLIARLTRADRWWAILGFPLFFSYGYGWGFVSFWFAMPIAFLFIAACLHQPSKQRLMALVFLAVLMLLSHAVAAFYGLLFGASLLSRELNRRDRVLILVGFGLSVAVLFAYLVYRFGISPTAWWSAVQWELTPIRYVWLASVLLSNQYDYNAAGISMLAGILLLYVFRFELCPEWDRKLPLFAILVGFVLMPLEVHGISLLFRLAPFLIPAAIIGFRNAPEGSRQTLFRLTVASIAAISIVTNSYRAEGFSQESEGLRTVLKNAEPGTKLVGLIYDMWSVSTPGPVHGHQGLWFEVYSNGMAASSYCRVPPVIVRYHESYTNSPIAKWNQANPRSLVIDHFSDATYFLVRATIPGDRDDFLNRAKGKVELAAESGNWSLYRRK